MVTIGDEGKVREAVSNEGMKAFFFYVVPIKGEVFDKEFGSGGIASPEYLD